MKTTLMPATVGTLLVLTLLGCERKPNKEEIKAAIQEMEAAKAAENKVAALEKQLEEMKAAQAAAPAGKAVDKDAALVAEQQTAAMAKQLEMAKRRAEMKKKAAQELAAKPAATTPAATPAATLEVPAGTELTVKLAKDLTTETAQAGDSWEGTLVSPITISGKTVWPAGTAVSGVVTQSVPAGRLSTGNGGLGIKVTLVGNADVATGTHLVVGDKKGARNAKYIGGAAALGALVGALSDKKHQKDHALGGAAIGAAVGTAAAAATADTTIKILAANPVTFAMSEPEKVTVK